MRRAKDVIVGVDMGGTSMRALVVDHKNEILAIGKMATNRGRNPGKLISDIAALVEETVEEADLQPSDIRALSIGAPGAVDPVRGIVHEAPNLGWREVALGRKLQALLLSIFVFVGMPIVNTYVRVQEYEADMYGLNVARQPDAFAEVNLMGGEYRKLEPGPVEEFIFFDHPSGRNRIYAAMRWKAEHLEETQAGR